MVINNISSPYFYYKKPLNFQGLIFRRNKELKTDILEKEATLTSAFLNKKGKVTFKEYQVIKEKHPEIIEKCNNIIANNNKPILDTTPEDAARIALDLKKYYDEKYKSYKIISIGTSPAMITEIMQNLGCDVLFLPISHLNHMSENSLYPLRRNYPNIASRFPNIKILMDYCTHKGIGKNKEKEIILLDFCSTGKSLRIMDKILKERGDISEEKIHRHSIIDDLENSINEESLINRQMIRYLNSDMVRSASEDVCNVPHFPVDDIDSDFPKENETIHTAKKLKMQIFKEIEDFSRPKGRAWVLCATDEAMKLLKH